MQPTWVSTTVYDTSDFKSVICLLHCHKLKQRELTPTLISAWILQKRAELDGGYLNEKWQPLVNPSAMALKYSSRWRAGRLVMCYITEFQLSYKLYMVQNLTPELPHVGRDGLAIRTTSSLGSTSSFYWASVANASNVLQPYSAYCTTLRRSRSHR